MSDKFYYGGQAVMEGVMMRGRKTVAIACRRPDGQIVVYEEEQSPGPILRKVRGWPLIRGVFVLWDTLVLGTRSLIFSANVGLQEDDEELEDEEPAALTGFFLWLTLGISLLFAIGLFFVLPLAIIGFLDRYIESDLVSNIIEGILRLSMLIGYLALIARTNDIRRVFGYHGAEHKTINAFESGLKLTLQNIRKQSLEHVRCGTGFLLLVVLISIFVFALLGRPPMFWRMLSRILLVPVIAAIAFEVIRIGAAHADTLIMKIVLKPGMVLQRLTTREPDDEMLEVAVAAFNRVAAADGVIDFNPADDLAIEVNQLAQPIEDPAIDGVTLAADGG